MERSEFDKVVASIACILVGGFFVLSGLGNILQPELNAVRLDMAGATFMVIAAALFKVSFGIAIAIRYHTRYASAALVLYVLFVSTVFYGPTHWIENITYEHIFYRNVALIGGLLFIYAHSRDYTHWREDTWMGKSQKEIVTSGGKSPTFNEGPPH